MRQTIRLSLALSSLLFTQQALSFQLQHTSIVSPSSIASLKKQKRTSLFVQVDADAQDFYSNSEQSTFPDDDNNEDAIAIATSHFPFPLDNWQLSAASSILSGHNVIVCAPTGSGKTVVGEIALRIALDKGTRAIYTTPLKALSNQKFGEMQKAFGVEKVGLATGDISIRRGADVTIMTTEVYRNMAWKSKSIRQKSDSDIQLRTALDTASANDNHDDYSDLSSNSIVVLDEFHYMGEKGRGSTWEESVIFNPSNTQIVGLSATLPNAHRLAAWMEHVTNRKSLLIQAGGTRPVPLRYYFATKRDFAPLFRDQEAGPGAPHGLLGLRGDGIVVTPKMVKKNKNAFGTKASTKNNSDGLPRGLTVHPIHQNAEESRLAGIDRRIQRIIQQRSYDEYDGYKGPTISAREQRQMKENMLKAELRKNVPSISTLIQHLQNNDLLPGIFFIFSRKGCDNAAESLCNTFKTKEEDKSSAKNRFKRRKGKLIKGKGRGRGRLYSDNNDWDLNEEDYSMFQDKDGRNFRADLVDQLLSDEFDAVFDDSIEDVQDESFLSEKNLRYYSKIGLLDYDDVKKVASRALTFNQMNPEIAFDDGVVEQMLCGVGSHHAGILPAHKAFVETLFRLELMKAVFATETLAAGINMPARTTVICSMAKRGDLGMNLLETSNMLQMAGRAGRRGMDIEGACVVAATAFEGPEDAVTILTNEVKPVVSQFTPSYALVVNLIERGLGKLDLARSIVEKSFGAWESRQRELDLKEAMTSLDLRNDDMLPEEHFLNALQLVFEKELLESRDGTIASQSKISKLVDLVDVLSNGKKLKKISKRYSGATSILELEQSTLSYLEQELYALENKTDSDLPREIMDSDKSELLKEIKIQRQRVLKGQRDVNASVVSIITKVANNRMRDETDGSLRKALAAARQSHEESADFVEGALLEPDELNAYIKVAPKNNRNPLLDQSAAPIPVEESEDESWGQMQALIKVLGSYGCLIQNKSSDAEDSEYKVTAGGEHVGSLGMENSLWVLSALGGAWDVAYESAELDQFQDPFGDGNNEGFDDVDLSNIPKPQLEADTLTKELCEMSAGEIAGYISSLVVDAPRKADSAVESFHKLTVKQQRVVQGALLSLERLVEVQRRAGLDDAIGKTQLELSSCNVVTAWASGASWNEVLTISGAAPGDLVRILSRALDALRQLANLPYIPTRSLDGSIQLAASGINPKIKSLCMEAVIEMDRYPVKDDLPFQEDGILIDEEVEIVTEEDKNIDP